MSNSNNDLNHYEEITEITKMLREMEVYRLAALRYQTLILIKKLIGKEITPEEIILSMRMGRNENGELVLL